MKFKFSLEKVLKHRHVVVDLAKRDFMAAQSKYFEAEKAKEDMIQEKNLQISERSKIVSTQKNWQELVGQINFFLAGQDLRIARQNESLKKLEKEVEFYREILLKALTEARMIERLKEKKKAEFIELYNETEGKELDEIATLRFARNEKE